MPYPFKRAPLPSLALTAAQDAGVRRYIELEGNSFNYMLLAVITMTVVVSVAGATATRNAGSAAAAFDVMGVEENGADRIIIDPRTARFLAEALSLSGLSSKRALPAIGTYQMREVVPLFFSLPNTMDPGETAFREKDPTAKTKFFVQLSANAAARLFTVGGATVAISNINVDLQQVHNRAQKHLSRFVPSIRQLSVAVNGANGELPIPIYSDKYLAGLVLMQDSDSGEVDDIINKVAIRSDLKDYVGPKMEKWANLVYQSELEFGGAVTRVAGTPSALALPAFYYHSFTNHGRLSTLVDPNETNLRVLADCQPSALGTNSIIRVTLLELARDLNQYSGPNGQARMVCDPSPLPWQTAA